MKLYLYGDLKGNYYAGRTPAGRVRYTRDSLTATHFTRDDVECAEDCLELGLFLYSMEVSEPVLESQFQSGSPVVSQSTTEGPGPSEEFKQWEIYPMDLFGSGRN